MKPLPAVPHTLEDAIIAYHFVSRRGFNIPLAFGSYILADRRDAALMSWLTGVGVRHYAGLAIPAPHRLPLAHLWVRIDPEWPLGHHMFDLT